MSSTLTPEDIARLRALLNQFPTPATPTMPQLLSSSPASAVQPTGGTSLTPLSSVGVPVALSQGVLPQAVGANNLPGLPPITQLYHSNQLSQQGRPALQSGSQPSPFHPFLGPRPNLPSTAIANQVRLASASATLPHQVSLSRRGRRQGAAPQPPVLGQTTPRVSIQ